MQRFLLGSSTIAFCTFIVVACARTPMASPNPTVRSTVLMVQIPTPTVAVRSPATATRVTMSTTAIATPSRTAETAVATTAPVPTFTPLPATSTIAPSTAVPTSAVRLTADQIAATAVAESVGEQCVASPPKPDKGFVGDPARGKVLFSQRGCAACHGDQAQGGVGPKLAGTTLPFDAVLHQLRQPRGVMQRYLPADQSDADECDVYLYVKGLKS